MSGIFSEINVNTNTGEAALLLLIDAIMAVVAEGAANRKVSVEDIIEVIRIYIKCFEKDFPLFDEFFKNFSVDDVQDFRDRGMALWAAKARYDAVNPKTVERKALYKEAGVLKEKVVQILNLKYGEDPDVMRTVEKAKPGTGYKDKASDLTAYYPILDKNREKLVEAELITEEEIDRVGTLPELLMDKTRDPKKAAKLLCNQAWVYFLESYHKIRRHVEFLHYNNPEKLGKYPSLFSYGRTKKSRKPEEKPQTFENMQPEE